ncbi:MAG: hypothetical protein JW931_05810 [Methanomicrobiaceae archaeon]|nr:hypothetical protein [Methanomicrobiaceae archaeon]
MNYRIYTGKFDIPGERKFLGEVRDIGKSSSVYIVFFDASAIAGCRHIRAALSFAERSFFENKNPISNFFEMEILLYALGTRQTGFASGFGIHRGMNDSVILICSRIPEDGKRKDFEEKAGDAAGRIASLDECTENNIILVRDEDCLEHLGNLTADRISGLAEIFSLTREEIELCGTDRIEELVIERCALLDVNR